MDYGNEGIDRVTDGRRCRRRMAFAGRVDECDVSCCEESLGLLDVKPPKKQCDWRNWRRKGGCVLGNTKVKSSAVTCPHCDPSSNGVWGRGHGHAFSAVLRHATPAHMSNRRWSFTREPSSRQHHRLQLTRESPRDPGLEPHRGAAGPHWPPLAPAGTGTSKETGPGTNRVHGK